MLLVFSFLFLFPPKASISQPGDGIIVSRAVANTLIACGSGGIVVLFIIKMIPGGKWSIIQLINGCLAGMLVSYPPLLVMLLLGMVSVCAGCDGYYPWASILVASIAGVCYVIVSRTMVSVKVDDPLDAVAVHASSGLWGTIAAPIFMEHGGIVSYSCGVIVLP